MSIYLATRDVENREHVRIRIVHANEFRLNEMNNPRCELKRAKITENKDHKDEISPTVMILQNTVCSCVMKRSRDVYLDTEYEYGKNDLSLKI